MIPLAKPSSLRTLHDLLFYHDLVRHGGLPQAVDAALCKTGSDLRVTRGEFWVATYARVELRHRFSQISIAAIGRIFIFDCWDHDDCLAHGTTRSLKRLARAIDRWVRTDCTATALAAEFHFVRATPDAGTYEQGEDLEGTWQKYVSEAEQRMTREHWEWDRWDEFVVAAAQRPELRQLFPVPSHMFSFSRCTRYPFPNDTPIVWSAGDNGYRVLTPDGELLGQGDAEYAADLVVRHLPENCGPAIVGTSEDLALLIAQHEGTTLEEALRRLRSVRYPFASDPR